MGFFHEISQKFTLPLKDPVLVFSLLLLIILFSPIIFRRLNIPSIIVLIISGIIIGPHGFNILENNSAIELFSTIGLLYIMFIAGLELNLHEFIANRNKSLVFGFLTFSIPVVLGFSVFHWLLSYNLTASFLIASMLATQTLVAYPIVSKLGLSKNEVVAIIIGGTIFTNTAGFINLAIIKNIYYHNISNHFWFLLIIQLIVFIFFIFFVIPRITRYFFSHLESEKYSHYIFVLSMLFLSAFAAQLSGLEPIIGAFAAGFALNPLIPKSSALMNRIEFIGNSLFIPFFLISVGMIIDLKVFFSSIYSLWISTILISLALFSKWLAALLTQWIYRYSYIQRQLIYGLSSAHAAAILVFILVGYREQIIDETIFNSTIILILVSCMVSSFVTDKNAKKLILESNSATQKEEKYLIRGDVFLIPIINWERFPNILRLAILLRNIKSAYPISILTVVPNDTDAESNIIKFRKKAEEFIDAASATETPINTIVTIDHNVAGGILRTAREIMANTIIMGWPHSAGFLEKLFGEKTNPVLEALDKNVIIADIKQKFNLINRLIVIAPPFSDKEFSFRYWANKINKLSNEIHAKIIFYGTESVFNVFKNESYFQEVSFIQTETIDHLDFLSSLHTNNDLIIFISFRKGSVSFYPELESLPEKLNKQFDNISKLIIYPQQTDILKDISIIYDDTSKNPIRQSLKVMKFVGKGIEYIVKKK